MELQVQVPGTIRGRCTAGNLQLDEISQRQDRDAVGIRLGCCAWVREGGRFGLAITGKLTSEQHVDIGSSPFQNFSQCER